MSKFRVGDEVIVVRVRAGLGANVGDRGVVWKVEERWNTGNDPCTVEIHWAGAASPIRGALYDNQFELFERPGPW